MPNELVSREHALASILTAGWERPDDWKFMPLHKKDLWMKERYGLVPPKGWENYSVAQKTDWFHHQRKREKSLEKQRALIAHRIASEKGVELPPIEPFELPEDYDENNPRYVVRCIYGPMQGLPMSRILALNYDKRYLERRCQIRIYEDDPAYGEQFMDHRRNLQEGLEGVKHIPSDVVGSAADAFGTNKLWGPRMFLWQLFDAVAALQGDCVIYFPHNGIEMRVVPEEFLEWIQKAQEDPVKALTEPLALLEG